MLRTHCAMAVGTQLEAQAARVLQFGIVFDAVDMAEADLAGEMVAPASE